MKLRREEYAYENTVYTLIAIGVRIIIGFYGDRTIRNNSCSAY